MHFEIVDEITDVETIAVKRRFRERPLVKTTYGRARWRKRRGKARVRLPNGHVRLVELHWYEAHGVGKREIKRKRYLEGV